MRSPDDTGKFQAQIGEDVIEAALKSVEKHAGPKTSGAGDEGTAPPPAGNAAASDELAAHLETARQELEQVKRQARELMDRLKAETEKVQAEAAKVKDEHDHRLRALADLENFKRRAAKEKEETQKFGNERLLRDFLPVLDNLDRGLDAVKAKADFDSFKKGVEMTRRLFEDALGKHGVKGFSAKGQPFDPAQHEAMSSAETDELPPNHVFAEMVRGFTLNDRLMRPALVVVSVAKPKPAPSAEEPGAAAAPAADTPATAEAATDQQSEAKKADPLPGASD